MDAQNIQNNQRHKGLVPPGYVSHGEAIDHYGRKNLPKSWGLPSKLMPSEVNGRVFSTTGQRRRYRAAQALCNACATGEAVAVEIARSGLRDLPAEIWWYDGNGKCLERGVSPFSGDRLVFKLPTTATEEPTLDPARDRPTNDNVIEAIEDAKELPRDEPAEDAVAEKPARQPATRQDVEVATEPVRDAGAVLDDEQQEAMDTVAKVPAAHEVGRGDELAKKGKCEPKPRGTNRPKPYWEKLIFPFIDPMIDERLQQGGIETGDGAQNQFVKAVMGCNKFYELNLSERSVKRHVKQRIEEIKLRGTRVGTNRTN